MKCIRNAVGELGHGNFYCQSLSLTAWIALYKIDRLVEQLVIISALTYASHFSMEAHANGSKLAVLIVLHHRCCKTWCVLLV